MDLDIALEKSYPTPFANSPLLPLLLLSLARQKHVPKTTAAFKYEYDYIIVGAGSAGSTLASRLSEVPCVSVLLLEAGTGKVPLLNDVPTIGKDFWSTNLDWQYKTVPQKHTGEALPNRQVVWPSGKGVGGSSLLNAMLYVRGNWKNYDDWVAQGATGWSARDVWPYFLKLEDNRYPEYLYNGYHATGGPITVERPGYKSEMEDPLFEAARQLGYRVGDSNADIQTGVYKYQGNFRNGQRCSTAKAYLVPAENRINLDIVAEAHVRKVLLEREQAVGVEFDFQGITYKVKARKEVILSAGAVNSAQLLMLSGIGKREHLEKFGIPVVADLPVGDNLQDHCVKYIPFDLDANIPTGEEKLANPQNIQEYINYRTGPLASSEFVTALAFLNSPPISRPVDFPDYQLFLGEYREQQSGSKREGPKLICGSQSLQPKSRGTVRLNSSNPYDPPVIDPNYFDDPDDFKPMVEGLKTCVEIMASEPMKKIGTKPFPNVVPECEQFLADMDSYFTCVVKNDVGSLSHPVGTCKMGDPRNSTSVVDPLLRVIGIKGLRVVDASVIPIIPSGNTNIPTIMVAEKAADIIKESISCAYG